MLAETVISSLTNLVVLAIIPFSIYYVVQAKRHGRGLRECARRVGLRVGKTKYLVYSAGAALVVVIGLILFPPPVDLSTGEGSAFAGFAGEGFGVETIVAALLYGGVKTGSLFVGWIRIKSDSILGPWLIHAAANVTVALIVATTTA